MPFYKNIFAVSALGLGIFQLANAQETPPSIQLFIGDGDNRCGTAGQKDHYYLYTYPANTDKCITIGAPGFPFFSDEQVTQCGDYTKGGGSAECNNYPQNAVSVQLFGNIECSFYSTINCSLEDEKDSFSKLSSADTHNCEDFPVRLPVDSHKDTVSSLTCVSI